MKIHAINCSNSYHFTSNTISANNIEVSSAPVQQMSNMDKLNNLFPQGELQKIYNDISKELKLDYTPNLKLLNDYTEGWAGGYTFNKNEITLCLKELLNSDYKIVGVKNGKKSVLVSPQSGIPLFADKALADTFIKNAASNRNYGYDSIEIVPTTQEDKKRYVVQKVCHELIHAQQHMILRQTEGVGEKGIIKAWTHLNANTPEEKQKLDNITEQIYKTSFWADKPLTPIQIKRDNLIGMLAMNWLESIKNYPPVDSPLYNRCAIEVDAYRRSADYVYKKYGQLSV